MDRQTNWKLGGQINKEKDSRLVDRCTQNDRKSDSSGQTDR